MQRDSDNLRVILTINLLKWYSCCLIIFVIFTGIAQHFCLLAYARATQTAGAETACVHRQTFIYISYSATQPALKSVPRRFPIYIFFLHVMWTKTSVDSRIDILPAT